MAALIKELQRRNVIRVAAAYLIIGWLFVQVLEVAADSFDAPVWVMKMIITLVIIGFIPAVLFSWAFELTPDGLRKDSDVDRSNTTGAQTSNKLNIVTIFAAVAVFVFIGWQQLNPPSAAPADEQPDGIAAARTGTTPASTVGNDVPAPVDDASIAVLPFADLSPDSDQGYFSDGVSEEILNVLARIEGLRVASRTSAFAFKNSQQRIPEIASELRVRHILEGSVRRAGDTIRITAQLIDAQTDEHLFSETFDRKLTAENVFAIQGEIAGLIVTELASRIDIAGGAAAVSVDADTANLATLDLYYEANALFLQRGRDNLTRALNLFSQITEREPDFARGWAGLAAVYAVARSWGVASDDNFGLAIAAANRAIEINPQLSTPYAVLANVETNLEKPDWSSVAENFELALQKNPDDANLYNWRGLFWDQTGFTQRAFDDYDTCLTLDPSYINCGYNKHNLLVATGQNDKAEALHLNLLMKGAYLQVYGPAHVQFLADKREDNRLLLALNLLVADSYPEQRWMVKELYQALTDPDFDHQQRLTSFEQRRDQFIAADGIDVSNETDRGTILFAFRDFDRAIMTGYFSLSSFRIYPDIPPAQKRRAIIKKHLPKFWHEHGFPPQCRPVGKDDFKCDWDQTAPYYPDRGATHSPARTRR